MKRRSHPLKWPACITVALSSAVLIALLLPASWIAAFFTPLALRVPPPAPKRDSLVLLPEEYLALAMEIRSVEDRDAVGPQPRLYSDAEWWHLAWQVHLREGQAAELAPGPGAAPDSLPAYLAELRSSFESILRQVATDSVLAAQLAWLRLEDRHDLRTERIDVEGMTRQRSYSDFQSRTAAAFDEHLLQSIPITDTAADRERRAARAATRR